MYFEKIEIRAYQLTFLAKLTWKQKYEGVPLLPLGLINLLQPKTYNELLTSIEFSKLFYL